MFKVLLIKAHCILHLWPDRSEISAENEYAVIAYSTVVRCIHFKLTVGGEEREGGGRGSRSVGRSVGWAPAEAICARLPLRYQIYLTPFKERRARGSLQLYPMRSSRNVIPYPGLP